MISRPLLEFELIDADDNVYLLGPETRHALEISGLGMPPISHWTTRSPFQHGRTHWGYAYGVRPVDMVLVTKGCGRDGMYAGRAANIVMLDPANSPLKLRLRVPRANLVYELHGGWYTGGYELSSGDQSQDVTDIWNQIGNVSIDFMDPFWKWVNSPLGGGETRDADGRTCISDNTWTITAELELPFAGPYLLGVSPGTNTLTPTNDSGVGVKPVIAITGPIEDWVLTNTTNGYQLSWNGYSIAGGETVTIDIPARTVTSSVIGDVSVYLSGDTGTFELDPGANTIEVYGSDAVVNAATTVSICWYVEILGT